VTGTDEKKTVALYSILAAIFLIAGKTTVGLLSGSLAILTDALHSLMDLGASIITYFAVKISDKPADRDHHFGHGKVESMAALVQVLALIATCGFIITEAIGRIGHTGEAFDITYWSYGVIVASILIDMYRVRALRRVAKKYSSQALAADALNFSTDIYSSLIVLFGLVAVSFGFAWADPVAAIGVTIFIISATLRMAKQAIDVLLDRAPQDAEAQIEQIVAQFPEIINIDRMRLRSDGRMTFVELVLDVDRSLSFAKATDLKENLRRACKRRLPRVDVISTFKPTPHDSERLADSVRYIVSSFGLSLHHLIINREDQGYFASMHIEMPGAMSLHEAHEKASEITRKLHDTISDLHRVVIHTEPYEEDGKTDHIESDHDIERIADRVKEIVESFDGVHDCHNIFLTPHTHGLALSADMRLDGKIPLDQTHQTSKEVEKRLLHDITELVSVTLHMEPL